MPWVLSCFGKRKGGDSLKSDIMSEINKAFGRVVVRLRKARGQSQEDFAWSIDSDRKYMSDVELGKRNVSLNFVAKVAEGFGISVYNMIVLTEQEMRKMKVEQTV